MGVKRIGTVRLCNYVDVFHNSEIDGQIDFMRATATSSEISKFHLWKGDVVFTKDSETPEEIAVPAFVSENVQDLVCGYHLGIARARNGVDGRYLFFAIKHPQAKRQFRRVANGVTRFGLTLHSVGGVLLAKPPFFEQKRIADILSTWDRAIEDLARQIAHKENVLAYLREVLVNGARRLNRRTKPWPVVALGSILSMHNERLGSGKTLTVYSVTKNGLVPQEQHFKKRIASSNLSRHIVVRRGDFALSGLNFWLGSVGVSLLDEPVCISPDYKVFKVGSAADPRYFRHTVRTRRFVDILRNAAVERASVVRRNFDRETFLASELTLPPTEEQEAIVEVLDDAEREIAALAAERRALEKQRDALATELLTGRIRMSPAEVSP